MLPTGCKAIDSVLGGGLVPRRINQFYGASGTGKTNICLQALVTAVESGKKAVYVDTEGGFSEKRLNQLTGGEADEVLDNSYFYRVTSFSEQERVISDLKDHDVDLVIVDSLTSLYRPKLGDGDAKEVNRNLSKQVRELSELAEEKDIPVLITNQVYSDFNSDNGEVIPVGGDTLKYCSKVVVQLERHNPHRVAVLKKHIFRRDGERSYFKITHTGLEGVKEKDKSNFS